MRSLFFFLLLSPLLLCIFASSIHAETNILVIPKGEMASYWKVVSAGALKAGEELGVNVVVRGPRSEEHHGSQQKIIAWAVAQGFHAIVLAPVHKQLLTDELQKAVEKGVKVVLIDSDMAATTHSSLVSSDNYRAGVMAADKLAALIDRKGGVVLARHISGHASTQKREQAFLETISSKYPQISVVADPYVGVSRGHAYHEISELLGKQPIDGIFCDSEEATLGILSALEEHTGSNRPEFIGFDYNETIREALINGQMSGTVVQDPYAIGYQGVIVANKLLNNQEVSAHVYTDTHLVTKENIGTPAIQRIIRSYAQSSRETQ